MNNLVKHLRQRDEDGSSLILALFFAFLFSVLVTAVITFADTGLRASKGFRVKRLAAVGPEAAMQAAINSRLLGAGCDTSFSPRFDVAGDVPDMGPLPVTDPQSENSDLAVLCQNLAVSAAEATTGSADTPRTALLALGEDEAEGIVTGTGTTRVRGDVFSRSRLATSGSLVVEGRASAIGDCIGNIATQTNPGLPPRCANLLPAPDPVAGRDPDFSRSTTVAPIRRTVPVCSDGRGENGWFIRLDPGYYDNATDLSSLTDGSCPGVLVWMSPGTYYLDFGFVGGVAGAWKVTNAGVDVVGGEPRGWTFRPDRSVNDGETVAADTTVTSATANFVATDAGRAISGGSLPPGTRITSVADPQTVVVDQAPIATESGVNLEITEPRPSALPVPGSCLGTGDAGYDDGVEMIVGGMSRIEVDAGRMELCAPPRSSEQQIALYGVKPDQSVHVLAPLSVPAFAGFSNPARALVIGESDLNLDSADATIPAGSPDPAGITLGTFRRTIPPNAVIDSALLRLSHAETGDVGQVRVNPSGCSGGTQVLPPSIGSELVTHTVDLVSECGLDKPLDFASPPFTVSYEVTSAAGAVQAQLDGIAIDVAFRVPVTRKPTTASVGGEGFTTPGNAFEIGERPASMPNDAMDDPAATAPIAVARAELDPSQSATLTLGGFADPPIPAGSSIDAAALRVAHRAGDGTDVDPTVTVSFPSSTCTTPQTLTPRDTLGEDLLSLDSDCGLNAPGDLEGLTVTYEATKDSDPGTAIVEVDGIWLDLLYSENREASTIGPSTGFTDPTNAFIAGNGSLATAALADPGTTAASIDLSGAWSAALPDDDAILDTARLRVRHRQTGDIDPGGVTLTPSFAGSTCTAGVSLDPRSGPLVDDYVDLKACGLGDDLVGLTVNYEVVLATGGAAATAELDGIDLLISYRPPTVRGPVGPPTDVSGSFLNPDRAVVAGDGQTADAALLVVLGVPPLIPPVGITSASLTLNGLGLPAPLPAGSVIDEATLRVHHRDDGFNPGEITVTPSFPDAGCSNVPISLQPGSIGVSEILLHTGCGFNSIDDLVSFSARYDATIPGNLPRSATTRLDGMELEIVFRAPAIQALTGDLLSEPYDTLTPEGALVSTGGGASRFVVDGTVYAPTAALDLAMSGLGDSAATRGIVARTIDLDVAPTGFDRPVIGVPPESALFSVYPRRHLLATTATTPPGNFTDPDNAKAIDGALTTRSTLDDPGAVYVREPTSVVLPTAFGPTPDDGMTVNGTTTDVTLQDTGILNASIGLQGMGTPSIPAAAILDSAVLTVDYESTDPNVAVSVTPSGCAGPLALMSPNALGTPAASNLVADCGFADPTDPANLNGLTVAFDAVLSGTGPATVRLDGMSLLVTYRLAASITVGGFGAPADLDSTTPLDAVLVRVAHGFDAPDNVESATIKASGTATACDVAVLPVAVPPAGLGVTTFAVDLRPCGVATVADLGSLSFTYTVTLKPGTNPMNIPSAVTTLDGIEVELYSDPVLRAQVTFQANRATIEGWSVLS